MSKAGSVQRPRAPIAWQITALLFGAVCVAQAITFVVLVVTPAPRPNFYRMEEIAAALNGSAVQPRDGRPLRRTLQSQAPELPDENDGFRNEGAMRHLTEVLGVSENRVILFQPRPPAWTRLLWRRAAPFGGRGGRGGPPPAGRGFVNVPGQQGGPPPGEQRRFFRGPVLGQFTAAVRRPDGRWAVVRPAPEPFPTEWQKRMGLWLLGCLLLAAPAGYLFGRRITAPVRAFADAAETLGRDPHGPLMTLSGPAEIGAAARAFNAMQARLKRYVEDRTAMVGAISHDLRTPLARMRFKLEKAPKDLRESVLQDVGQMEEMITAVLAFIRDGAEPRRRERLDLLSLVECEADGAGPGGGVVVEPGPPVAVEADALGLQRLFANLIANAAKYAGGARITVRVEDDEAVVDIADDGPGVPPGELERVFSPFYRASAARTLDDGGVGLGLAVARSIARAHGGDVTLAARPEGGILAQVRLPLARG